MLINEYALISEMLLITRKYGMFEFSVLRMRVDISPLIPPSHTHLLRLPRWPVHPAFPGSHFHLKIFWRDKSLHWNMPQTQTLPPPHMQEERRASSPDYKHARNVPVSCAFQAWRMLIPCMKNAHSRHETCIFHA